MASLIAPLDVAAAQRFLAALTGIEGAGVCWQCFDDLEERKDKQLTAILVGTLLQHLPTLTRLNARGAGVFTQINEGLRGKAKVTGLRALFADNDSGKEIILPIEPNIIVQSSKDPTRKHFYWLLQPGEPLDQFEQAQKRIAAALGTDPTMKNLDRVMRLPGGWHKKYQPAFQVRLLKCDPEPRRTIEEIVKFFPEIAPPPTKEAKIYVPGMGQPLKPGEVTAAAATSALRLRMWLLQRNQGFTEDKTDDGGFRFRLFTCPLDNTHKDAQIVALPSGAIHAGCFHASCGANSQRWDDFKKAIGQWRLNDSYEIGDHKELAEQLLDDVRDNSPEPIVYANGAFLRYDQHAGLWDKIEEDAASRILARYSGASVGENGRIRLKEGDFRGVPRVAARLVSNPHFFEGAPMGIAFKDGFLRVDDEGSISFQAHAATHRATDGFPFQYDTEARSPLFWHFLKSCFAPDEDADEKIRLLQEFTGACLMGVATRFQKALVLSGADGENGKSTFIDIISELFPEHARAAVPPQEFGQPHMRARLAGIRLNATGELPETEIMASSAFKAFISGDALEACRKYQHPFSFRPIAGHLYSANLLPAVADHSGGFWRRFLLVTWNRKFTEKERDDTLKDRIIAAELPGVAMWAVSGARRLLQRRGYTMPTSMRSRLQQWREDTDSVAAWLAECTKLVNGTGGSGVLARQAYQMFVLWCEDNGNKRLSQRKFAQRLSALGQASKHTETGSRYPFFVPNAPIFSQV